MLLHHSCYKLKNFLLAALVALSSFFIFAQIHVHASDPISITVNITWYGDTRESATVQLYTGDTEVASKTITADDNWTYTFTNLDGNLEYRMEEESIDGYTAAVAGFVETGFTVIYTQLISVSVKKTWIGDPGSSATVRIYANGTEEASATLPVDNSWTYSFPGLAKANDDGDITYTLTEDPIDGYTSEISGNAENGFTVTNTKLIDIPVTKIWLGDPGSSATVHLYANGTEAGSMTLTSSNSWNDTFEDLAQADSNGEITYTLKEDAIDGYASEVSGDAENGFTVTNTKLIDISVTKTWIGDPGSSATVHLYANGTEAGSATLTAADGWTHTFEDLAQADSYGEITYTLTEDTMDGYESSITGDAGSGFVVTNTKIPAGTLTLTAEKTVNNGNPDQSYTFYLLDADGNNLQTKQNDSDGVIQFDSIHYDASDVGNEFTYQVMEMTGSDEAVTYDSSVYTVKVTPYLDADDPYAIIADPVITKDNVEVSSITFNNTVDQEQESSISNSSRRNVPETSVS